MNRKIVMLGMLMGLLSASFAISETDPAEAAKQWLGIVDSGDFVQSFNKSAAFVRTTTTDERWVGQLNAVRNPLGAVKSRVAAGASGASAPEGAPAGSYTDVSFTTEFEKGTKTEKVTMMQTDDGQWESAAYAVE